MADRISNSPDRFPEVQLDLEQTTTDRPNTWMRLKWPASERTLHFGLNATFPGDSRKSSLLVFKRRQVA